MSQKTENKCQSPNISIFYASNHTKIPDSVGSESGILNFHRDYYELGNRFALACIRAAFRRLGLYRPVWGRSGSVAKLWR